MSMNLCGVIVVENVAGRPRGRSQWLGALEHVANRPIIHHVARAVRAAGADELLIVSSAAVADEVEEGMGEGLGSTVPVRHFRYDGELDFPRAMRAIAPVIGDAPCILHTAGGLLGEPLAASVKLICGGAPNALVIVHQGATSAWRLSPATHDMLHLAELDPDRGALGIAGVWLFGPRALQLAADSGWASGCGADLTTAAHRIAGAGGRLDIRPVESWRVYDGNPLDLLELNRIALDGLQAELRRPNNHGNQIEGRVWIHEDADVRSSVIVGPTIIGAGARICDAYIGPYTSIGARAQIEGAEIERSIISAGASILHVGGRIVASVVGRDARIFRDFSLPRALRLRVGDGTEVALC